MAEAPCQVVDGNISIVTLARPSHGNALDRQLRMDLAKALRRLSDSRSVWAVIITGLGPAFCLGADINEPFPTDRSVEQHLHEDYAPILTGILEMDKPVIAAVNGPAAGIGMSIVLACDCVIMGESAYLMSPFNKIGLIPDGGATWMLTRAMGYHRAFELCVSGEKLSAEKCFSIGICGQVVPKEAVIDAARAKAADYSSRAGLAVGLTKRALRQNMTHSFAEAFALEAGLQSECAKSETFASAVARFRAR